MITVSRVSRKTTRKTGTAKTSTAMINPANLWCKTDLGYLTRLAGWARISRLIQGWHGKPGGPGRELFQSGHSRVLCERPWFYMTVSDGGHSLSKGRDLPKWVCYHDTGY